MKVGKVGMTEYVVERPTLREATDALAVLVRALEAEHDARDDRERLDPIDCSVHDVVVRDNGGGSVTISVYVYENGPHETVEIDAETGETYGAVGPAGETGGTGAGTESSAQALQSEGVDSATRDGSADPAGFDVDDEPVAPAVPARPKFKRDRELLAAIVGGRRPFPVQVNGAALERGGYVRRWFDDRNRMVYEPTAKGYAAVESTDAATTPEGVKTP